MLNLLKAILLLLLTHSVSARAQSGGKFDAAAVLAGNIRSRDVFTCLRSLKMALLSRLKSIALILRAFCRRRR